MTALRDYLNLMSVAKIYLFAQLFITPLLLSVFAHSSLVRTIESELYFPLATTFTLESVAVSAVAYICFLLGGQVRLPQLTSGTEELDWRSPNVVLLFWVIFLAGFAFKLLRIVLGGDIQVSSARIGFFSDVATFFQSLNWFHMVALPFLAIAYYENRYSVQRVARYYPVVLLAYLVNGAINGATSFVIFPLMMHLAISQRYRPMDGLRIVGLGLVLVLLVYLKVYLKVLILDDPTNQFSFSAPLTFLVNRVSVSFVVSAITSDPGFSYGSGIIEQLLHSLKVPGFEYAISDGNALGRYYSIIRTDDFVTGVAISLVGDLVLHWGVVGASIGMFFIGMLYRHVASLSESKRRLPWIVYAVLWPIMLHGLESPVPVLIATIMKMAALCIAYYYFGRLFLLPGKNVRDSRLFPLRVSKS